MLSVIIPTFNGQDRVHSILSDLMKVSQPIEVIVVDDGSSDNTNISIQLLQDSRLKYFRTDNEGVAKARQFGLSKTSGEWVLFVDDDDRVCAHSLSKVITRLEHVSCDVLVFPYSTRKKLGSAIKIPFKEMSLAQYRSKLLDSSNPYGVFLWNRIYRTRLAQKAFTAVGEWDAPGEDAIFNEYIANAITDVKFIDQRFLTYYTRTDSLSKRITSAHVDQYKKVVSFFRERKSIGDLKARYLLALIDARSGSKRLSAKLIRSLFIVRNAKERVNSRLSGLLFSFGGVFALRHLTTYKNVFDVLNIDQTIQEIQCGKSIARFGDGEFRLIVNVGEIEFQEANDELTRALQKCISSYDDNLLICIPNLANPYQKLRMRLTWASLLRDIDVSKLAKTVGGHQTYGDALITRPFLGYTSDANKVFSFFQSYFKGKRILFVGGYSNEMTETVFLAKSKVTEIRVPNENAYCVYSRILKKTRAAVNSDRYDLLVASCGPVASLLCAEFSHDLQCIDIGHLHMEYEKFLLNANKL